MNVPLVDLGAQYRPLKDDIMARIGQAIESSQLFLGPNVQAFEREFGAYCGVEHAVGVSDGTTALQLALRACGVGPEDEVITASHTFIATAEAIALIGARPVFVDVDPETYTLDAGLIEARITPRTRAIVPVHLYGRPAALDAVLAVARAHGLRVVEDACQAHGARYHDRRTGGLADAAAFSFYFSKNLGAYGEGGMVTTNDAGLAEQVRMRRDHGSRKRYHHELVGMNGRLDEVQAAVLRAKLPHLDDWNATRRAHAAYYTAQLAGLPELVCPTAVADGEHVFHLYVLQVPRRDDLVAFLKERGVGAGIHYPVPCHLQPAFADLGYARGDLPVTERLVDRIISLPMYPELSEAQREYVVEQVRAFFNGAG